MSKHDAEMALKMKNAHMKKAGFTMKLMLFIDDLPPFKAWILCRLDQSQSFFRLAIFRQFAKNVIAAKRILIV